VCIGNVALCQNLAIVLYGRYAANILLIINSIPSLGGSVAEWLACWTQLKAEGPEFQSQPRRCRVTVLGKLFIPIVPLFTKQQNW